MWTRYHQRLGVIASPASLESRVDESLLPHERRDHRDFVPLARALLRVSAQKLPADVLLRQSVTGVEEGIDLFG